jgi:hypothetical protein
MASIPPVAEFCFYVAYATPKPKQIEAIGIRIVKISFVRLGYTLTSPTNVVASAN